MTAPARCSSRRHDRRSRDKLPAWLVLAIFVVWCAGGRAAALVRWGAGRVGRGLAYAAAVVVGGAVRGGARLPAVGRHARQLLAAVLADAGDRLVALRRTLEPLARTAWRRLVAGGIVLLGAARRGARWSAGATRRVVARAVTRRRVVTAAAVVVAVWASSAPGLRLGADLLSREVQVHGFPPLEEPSVITGRDGEVLTALAGGPNREVVALAEMPDLLEDMAVAVEDQRFWDHPGWDGAGMLRAALANVRAGEVAQGGSTISQQLAKENFAGRERTLLRKVEELLDAVALEDRYDKPQLLERYLNQVYLGARAYGVAAAAREYFGVGVADLSPPQAALLVALIRSPTALDPRVHPRAARDRRNAVLRTAAEHGLLDPVAAETFAAAPLGVAPPPPEVMDPLLGEAVRRELLGEAALGSTVEERARRLATGGLQIETSIDPLLQSAAHRAVTNGLAPWPGLGGALAAVDPEDGEVVALVSVSPLGTEAFDLAEQGRRQPGSTFKPLAAVAALEAGLRLDQELVGDGPVEIEYARGRRWTIDNFRGADHGEVDLEEALVSSVNTALAQVAVATGPEPIVDVARRLGIDVDAAMGPEGERGPSLALGALSRGVSPLEMATSYGVLTAGGRHTETTLVKRVVDGGGRELLRRAPDPRAVLDPTVAATITRFLQQAVDEGTGGSARLPGWEPAGKTGTSQQNADAWFVGAVPSLSVATWLGHPDAAQPVRGLTGGSAAAPVWRAFMATALRDAEPVPFPEPPSHLQAGEPLVLPEARRVQEQ